MLGSRRAGDSGPLAVSAIKPCADKLNTMTQVQGCEELRCLPCLELSFHCPYSK